MGMYTEMCVAFNLVATTPPEVTNMLKAMMDEDVNIHWVKRPDHPLFDSRRWRYMLLGGSAYFDGGTHASIQWEKSTKVWLVDIRCSLKNYNSEIQHFLEWLAPHIETEYGDGQLYIGTMHYEEYDLPDIIVLDRESRQMRYIKVTS